MPTVQYYKGDPAHVEMMYCVKMRQMVAITAPELVVMSNGKYALRGKCPHTGAECYKIISEARAKQLHPDT